MHRTVDDDFIIQATQLFNDAVVSEGIVAEYALEMENQIHREEAEPKENETDFVSAVSKRAHIARAAIVITDQFQTILEDYRKYLANKQKGKKGFKDL